MAEQKNNHFVPVFYLKLWSNNSKQINSYLINAKKTITATIRKETSKDYLYGQDKRIENAFSLLESNVKVIIDKIITSQSILELSNEEHMQLKGFMSVGAFRTQWQKDWYNHNINTIAKTLIQYQEERFDKDWEDKVNIRVDFPMVLKKNLPYLYMCLEDLSLSLIYKNNESRELVTSDNPVTILNPLAEQLKFSGTGFSCAGLIVYMPICPCAALLAYDANAYDIQPECADYDDLNLITVCNAFNSIYYKNVPISIIENYLNERKKPNDYPENVIINDENYIRIKKSPVHCALEDMIKIKSKIDWSKYEKREIGAPTKYIYVRKRSESIAMIFEEYKTYLESIKKLCQENNIPIDSVDTSFKTFLGVT